MAVTDFFNSSGLVEQPTNRQTGMGGLSKSYTSRIASLPCRLSIPSGWRGMSETDEFGKMTGRYIWRLYCEASSTNRAMDEGDRITVDSKVYQVKTIHNPGNLNRHLQIDLLLIE
jgi:hypothetical protein